MIHNRRLQWLETSLQGMLQGMIISGVFLWSLFKVPKMSVFSYRQQKDVERNLSENSGNTTHKVIM